MYLKLAWRNIWRNKRRTFITIVSIVLAVVLAVFMRAMQLGMYDGMIRNVVGAFTGYVQVHALGYWEERSLDNSITFDAGLEQMLVALDGVEAVVPRIQSFALSSCGELTKGALITGVDPAKEGYLSDLHEKIEKGEVFGINDDKVLVAKGLAQYYDASVGDTIVFIGQGYHAMTAAGKYEISGIIDLNNPRLNNITVLMPLPTMQRYLGTDDIVTTLIIAKEERARTEDVTTSLIAALDPAIYEVMNWHELMPELDQTIVADSIGGLIMVFILYMIITFGIFGTVLMMTEERMYEFGVLISIGMKRHKLMITIFLETVLLSLIAVTIGALLITPVVHYFNANPIELTGNGAEAMEKFGFDPVIPMLIDYSIQATHAGIICVVTVLMAFYPLWVISRVDPVRAMKR